jgi:predicted ATP-dependent Lon-type protease
MAQDVSKIYQGVIQEVGLTASGVNAGAEMQTGMIEGNLVMKATPVTTKNSQGESIIMAYDLSFEANLKQIKDYASITPYNNEVSTIKFHNYGSTDVPTLSSIRVNVEVNGDFSEPGKAGIKLSGTKRIETGDLASYFSFAII